MRTAAYARYSTELQSAASIEDQLRNVRAYCQRQGWPDPVVFSDAAISGARADRPGYLRLLADAGRFDVILVDDLSRLSRDSIETAQSIRRLTFNGVRVIGVSDGVDTGRKGHKAEVGLRGIMSELYLSDLADKTHRGLTGRALSGASAGGLPYGYKVAGVGQRVIDEAQAAVVRRIYAEYLGGMTARQIAIGLNRDGVKPARGNSWAMTAIHGDHRRGIGILANPIYKGEQVWNRSRWIKHPDSGRRVRQERPAGEWIRTEHPELAIVDAVTWNAVDARLRRYPGSRANGAGRPPRHLLSGILRCGECGGPMVVIDAYCYGCGIAKDRGTCSSRMRVDRRTAEHALLAGIRRELLTEERFQQAQRAVAAEIKRQAPNTEAIKRKLADAKQLHGNVMDAIRAGIITPSTKAELLKAEAEIRAAEHELASVRQPVKMVPRLRELWQRQVDALAAHGRNVPAAREALRQLLGDRITVKNENGEPVAEIAAPKAQINVVAGACSVLYLTEPVRIPLRVAAES